MQLAKAKFIFSLRVFPFASENKIRGKIIIFHFMKIASIKYYHNSRQGEVR